MELLVAPKLQPRLPIGGNEGAFCDDLGVLVIDEVSDGGYTPVRHEMPLSTLLHCSDSFASKKRSEAPRQSALGLIPQIDFC